jgi:signal transduction histidine kinase
VDPQRIIQVMANLLNNALKYTPENGSIDIVASKTKDNVQVSVKDLGIGMSKDTLGKIFTPFFQADSRLDRKYGGTGLGLPICKGIIETHGGKIWGESDGPGKGSTFTFTLPLKRSKEIPV